MRPEGVGFCVLRALALCVLRASGANYVQNPTALEVLANLIEKNGWNSGEEAILADLSEDDYYELFKHNSGDKLDAMVKVCLDFGKFVNATDQQKVIAANARAALVKIGKESKLNELRVKKFGVILE